MKKFSMRLEILISFPHDRLNILINVFAKKFKQGKRRGGKDVFKLINGLKFSIHIQKRRLVILWRKFIHTFSLITNDTKKFFVLTHLCERNFYCAPQKCKYFPFKVNSFLSSYACVSANNPLITRAFTILRELWNLKMRFYLRRKSKFIEQEN